jgi:hypothetical protein
LFRWRLRTAWSLPARVAFGAALAFELLVIGFVSPFFAEIWLLLVTLPALAWFFSQEQRNLQCLLLVFLDEVAKDHGMIKLQRRTATDKGPPKPAS